MRRVFVSYSRNNRDVVAQLVSDMANAGLDIWHDQALTGGQKWWENILANIRQCDVFIFALSPESWESEACRSELGYVVQLGKPILPVLVSDGISLNLLSAPLNEIQVTDYRRCDKESAFALLKSIHTASPTSPLPEPLPTPPRVPVSYLSTLRDRIDSDHPLSSQDQITLLYELEQELQEGHSPAETVDLLQRLRRRDDLLAKIGAKIDAAVKGAAIAAPPPREPTKPSEETRTKNRDDQPPKMPRTCAQCHAPLDAAAVFCGKCGAKAAAFGTAADGANTAPPAAGTTSRRFVCAPSDVAPLITDVKGWLGGQGFESQQMSAEGQNVLLQIKKSGGWRNVVGMATSLNILFRPSEETLTVEIGAGKWIDKATIGTLSMFVLWPLALTAGYGAWEQMKMPERILQYIGGRLICK